MASARRFFSLKSGLHYFTINRTYYEIGLYCEAKIKINPLFPLLQMNSIFALFVLSVRALLLQMQPFLPECVPASLTVISGADYHSFSGAMSCYSLFVHSFQLIEGLCDANRKPVF